MQVVLDHDFGWTRRRELRNEMSQDVRINSLLINMGDCAVGQSIVFSVRNYQEEMNELLDLNPNAWGS